MFRFVAQLFRRLFFIGATHADQALRRMERSIPMLEKAKEDLFNKAVHSQKQANLLEAKLGGIKDEKVKGRVEASVARLKTHAQQMKDQHTLFESKVEEFVVRKASAELLVQSQRAIAGVGGSDACNVLKELEREVQEIESEHDALLQITAG